MRVVLPRSNPSALLDSTRQLDPEEMAELQLEQGCADQALEIYERLLEANPTNLSYRRRRDWLVRLGAVRPRIVPPRAVRPRVVPASSVRPSAIHPRPLVPAGAEADAGSMTRVDTTLRGMQPPSEADGPIAGSATASEAEPGSVRRLRIVTV